MLYCYIDGNNNKLIKGLDMVAINELKEDKSGTFDGFLHYSVAKRESIKSGSMFEVDGLDGCFFRAADYVGFRTDINSKFSGFAVTEL